MVKDKPNSTRIYDEDGYRRRAACVCIKECDQNQVSLSLSICWIHSQTTDII